MILFEPSRVNRRRLPLVGLIVVTVVLVVCGLFILIRPDEDRNEVRPIVSSLIVPSEALASAANPSVHSSLSADPKEDIDTWLQSIPTAYRPENTGGLNSLEIKRRGILDWCSADPIAAADLVSALHVDREELLEQVALGWSKSDLNAAREWARGLPPCSPPPISCA